MDDRPEISRGLLQEMNECVRSLAHGKIDLQFRARDVVMKLNALEQPPDPASVAAHEWYDSDDGGLRDQLIKNIRQAYAEREKAVKELSNWLEGQGLARQKNANVRRLHGWDK